MNPSRPVSLFLPNCLGSFCHCKSSLLDFSNLSKRFCLQCYLHGAWNLKHSKTEYDMCLTVFFAFQKLLSLLRNPGLTWHANHTMLHKVPYKKTAYANTISFLFFFYVHSMESLSAINLYGQLMTLMLFCMVIQSFSCFSWIFFSTNNFQFFVYIVPSDSKVLKTSNPKWKSCQQLSNFNVPRIC